MKIDGKTVETPVTPMKVQAMLSRLAIEVEKFAADVASALKHWFPGDTNEEANLAIFLEFADVDPAKEAEWISYWQSLKPSAESAERVRKAAENLGYTDAAIEAVKEEEKNRGESKAVMDYVLTMLDKLPPIRYAKDEFFLYREGIWKEEDRRNLKPLALSVLAHKQKTSNMVELVLSTLACQVQWSGQFNSAICFGGDNNTVLLCCRTGVVKVTKGVGVVEMLEHSMNYNFTRKLLADFDESSECPLFEDAVDVALPGESDEKNPEKIVYADRDKLFWIGGWLLYPANPFKIALVCYGSGNTRKNTIVDNGLGSVFNPEDGSRQAVSLRDICNPKGYSIPGLIKSVVNFSGELNTLEIADTSRLKTLIASESVEVRHIGGKPFQVPGGYSIKLVFLANSQPMFKHGTSAEFNRLEFLMFSNPVARVVDDKTYRFRVQEERDGIFSRWMVPALKAILNGDKIPLGSRASIRQRALFGNSNDPVVAFAEERLDTDPEANRDDELTREDAEMAMLAFCQDHGFSEKLVPAIWIQLQKKCGLKLYRPTLKDKSSGKIIRWLPFVIKGAKIKEAARLAEYKPRDGRRRKGLDLE